MKSNKGVTLTSLIIYITAMLIIIGVVSTITIYFHKNTQLIQATTDNSNGLTRLNEYLLNDIKDAKKVELGNNKITITNSNGANVVYTYVSNGIYRNKVKICSEVSAITGKDVFELETIYDKTKLKLNISIGEKETISKTLEYTISN